MLDYIKHRQRQWEKKWSREPEKGQVEPEMPELPRSDLPEPTQRKLAGSETAIDPTKPDQSTSDWGGWMKTMRKKNKRRW